MNMMKTEAENIKYQLWDSFKRSTLVRDKSYSITETFLHREFPLGEKGTAPS